MPDYSLVEQMLPARFLTELGIYLQSAAHLELAIWQILMYSDGEFEPEPSKLIQYLETKKVTKVLVTELSKATPKLSPGLAVRVAALSARISDGLQKRNLAAHGAFFVEPANSLLHVAHYFAEGKKPNRQWFEANEKISRRTIALAIDEIDILLREAVAIRDAIKDSARK